MPKYNKFNHPRADFCVKECNRTMESLQSHQTGALTQIKERLGKADSCKEEVFGEAVDRLNRAATELT